MLTYRNQEAQVVTEMNERDTAAKSPNWPPRYLPTLDGWRAVAIVLVLVNHQGELLFGPAGFLPSRAGVLLTRGGLQGVNIFFGLSGFLICSRLIGERAETGSISLRAFYVRRFFRILPPYWTYLLFTGLLTLGGILNVGSKSFISALLFVRNYVTDPSPGGVYLNHFWSLAVEEHFYLIWPLLLAGSSTAGRGCRIAGMLALVITAWRAVDIRYHLSSRYLGMEGLNPLWRSDYSLDGLFLGCWVALLVSIESWRARLTRWLRPATWLILLAAYIGIAFLGFPMPIGRLWIAVLIPLLLLGTVLHPRSAVGRLLESAPLRWLGRISYSIYLWQQLFVFEIPPDNPLARFQRFPQNFALILAFALLSYGFVEKPMIVLGRRISTACSSGRVSNAG